MSDFYNVLPFSYSGSGTVPALHHLSRNSHKLSALGFFKPDKMRIVMTNYPKWAMFCEGINDNGDGSTAWQYLQNLQTGVFAQGYPGFQPCIFATAPFANNIVNVLSQINYHGMVWGKLRTMSVQDDPPQVSERDFLMQYGLVHKFVGEANKEKLSSAPKDSGNVFIPILGDGTDLFIQMSNLVHV